VAISGRLLAGGIVLLTACAPVTTDPTSTPVGPRPFPGLRVYAYVAKVEAAGIPCGLPDGDQPSLWPCVPVADPGVDSIGVMVRAEGRQVFNIYAYVVAPGRPDFDDYATTLFRDVVMSTLVDPGELPSFEVVRTAAQTSGRMLINSLTFQFNESSTTRSVTVTYSGP
jgi:hypothetical protein